jgi:hypothetical protein
MRREIFSGPALGSIPGCSGFPRIAAWSAISDLYGPHWLLVPITVGLTLTGIVLWGSLAGSMLRLALQRFGFNPLRLRPHSSRRSWTLRGWSSISAWPRLSCVARCCERLF